MSNFHRIQNQQTYRLQSYYTSVICQDLLLKNNYKNIFQFPTFDKIVLNTTSNSYGTDRKNIIPTLLALELITGQKVKFTNVKKSLASFKIRKDQIIGCKVTLRKKQLFNFLNVLITIVLPKLRNFPGIPKKSINNTGNLSFGFINLLLFPHLENHFEFFQYFRGININFSTNLLKKYNNQDVVLLLYTAYQLPQSILGDNLKSK